MWVTSNLLYRVVRLRGPEWGTGTIIDHPQGQFLLTAAHVVEGVHAGQRLDIESRWGRSEVLVQRKEARSDTAVLQLDERMDSVANLHCLIGGGHFLSQDVYIVGFPAGQGRYWSFKRGDRRTRELNPFVRKGVISNLDGDEIIIDVLVQKGFSGGPLVVGRGEEPPVILGIVSGGIVFPEDEALLNDRLGVTIRSGFTVCQNAHIAVGIIEDLF